MIVNALAFGVGASISMLVHLPRVVSHGPSPLRPAGRTTAVSPRPTWATLGVAAAACGRRYASRTSRTGTMRRCSEDAKVLEVELDSNAFIISKKV